MNTTLTSAGIACLIGGIVGGGLKAFGIEMPLLKSVPRQFGLVALGTVLLFAGNRQPNTSDQSQVSVPRQSNSACTITGIIYNLDDKSVLAGTQVWYYDSTKHGHYLTTAGIDGRFNIHCPSLPPNDYPITLSIVGCTWEYQVKQEYVDGTAGTKDINVFVPVASVPKFMHNC